MISIRRLLNIKICKQHRLLSTKKDNDGSDTKLNLAKPVKKSYRAQPDVRNDVITEAVEDVANQIGGQDLKKRESIASELFAKLRDHKSSSPSESVNNLSEILSGIKIEKVTKPERKQYEHRPSRLQRTQSSDKQIQRVNIKLFSGPKLDIFTKSSTTSTAGDELQSLTIFDEVEQRKLQAATLTLHNNALEEAIDWTNRGILWKFPIDNEQDIGEEDKVGFHEHVFLDHLIKDFPSKGPIRHFMELVITGLSKNAYLSVSQKEEHVEWFRTYFADKLDIVSETTGLETKMNA